MQEKREKALHNTYQTKSHSNTPWIIIILYYNYVPETWHYLPHCRQQRVWWYWPTSTIYPQTSEQFPNFTDNGTNDQTKCNHFYYRLVMKHTNILLVSTELLVLYECCLFAGRWFEDEFLNVLMKYSENGLMLLSKEYQ